MIQTGFMREKVQTLHYRRRETGEKFCREYIPHLWDYLQKAHPGTFAAWPSFHALREYFLGNQPEFTRKSKKETRVDLIIPEGTQSQTGLILPGLFIYDERKNLTVRVELPVLRELGETPRTLEYRKIGDKIRVTAGLSECPFEFP